MHVAVLMLLHAADTKSLYLKLFIKHSLCHYNIIELVTKFWYRPTYQNYY